jgi:hypothetical protein
MGKESRPNASDSFEAIWNIVSVGIDPSFENIGTVVNGKINSKNGDQQTVLVWADQTDWYDREVTPPQFKPVIRSISALIVPTEEIITVRSNEVLTTPEFKSYPTFQVTEMTRKALAKLSTIDFEIEPAV